MRQLISDLLPHAPQMGLYAAPNIPADKLRNAVDEFGGRVADSDVLVLYDATLLGSAKDGGVFTADRLIFQNNDLEPIHEVRYADIVKVASRRKLIGGRRVVLSVNRGRATFDLEIDFSGRPEAAEYVARFLKEAMLREESAAQHQPNAADASRDEGVATPKAELPEDDSTAASDFDLVRKTLQRLHEDGALSKRDLDSLLQVLAER